MKKALKFDKDGKIIEDAPGLPQVPDESKLDMTFVLPFFGKPGRHSFLIKYKSLKERYQRKLWRKC